MPRVLITGASGLLGRQLLARPASASHRIRATSRGRVPRTDAGTRAHGGADGADVEWVRADLATGEGLGEALRGVEVVVHAATAPGRAAHATDVAGTERLLRAAAKAGVQHVVYVSIVGVDRVPVDYYRRKLDAETLVRAGALPWTIVRGTQFHPFMASILRRLAFGPIGIAPVGFRCQPLDAGEFADALWQTVDERPAGRTRDVGGPEVLTWEAMLRAWLAARGRSPRVLALPVPGAAAAALRRGDGTAPAHATGRVTWEAWLRAQPPGTL
jgi:uncharacterized protein YbjT (DUF2867 family)